MITIPTCEADLIDIKHLLELWTYQMCPHKAPSISAGSLPTGYATDLNTRKPLEDPGNGFSLEAALLMQTHILQAMFCPYPPLTSDWTIHDIARYLWFVIILFRIVIVDPRGQFPTRRQFTHRGNLTSWGHPTSWGNLQSISAVVPGKWFPFPRVGVIDVQSGSIMGCGRKNNGRKEKVKQSAFLTSQLCSGEMFIFWYQSSYCTCAIVWDWVTYESIFAFCQQANSAVPVYRAAFIKVCFSTDSLRYFSHQITLPDRHVNLMT